MGALADIYALAKIVLDTGQFQTDAVKAGDDAANKVSSRMGSTLRKRLGAALATGFAAAAAGATALDEVAAHLQAETGATADEAQRMAEAVNAIAGRTKTSLTSVSAAYAAVRTDMQLTGKAAEDTTERVADFARVTGTDAAEDVKRLDDVSDAWNLTNEQSLGLLDQLIASHQKYGGSITDNMEALRAMAPQLQALGASLDDGVGLLNLFASSGLDAAKAQQALNTAVKNLKPGQTLDDLVAEISAIPDPTDRAKRAIEVFGSRGGVALASALKPGIGSLRSFGATAADSAGAVERAADAIDSTIPGIVRGWISGAQAAVRGFGDNFGPGLMAIAAGASLWSSFSDLTGLKLGGALKWAWAKVAASPAVLAAANAAGIAQGEAEAAGAAAGFGSRVASLATIGAFVIPVVFAVSSAKDQVDRANSFLDREAEAIRSGSVEQMQKLRDELSRVKPSPIGGPSPVELADAAAAVKALDEAIAKATRTNSEWDRGWEQASGDARATVDQFHQAGNEAGTAYVQSYAAANNLRARIAQDIRDTMAAAAQAVRDSKQQLLSAWSTAFDEQNALADAKDQIIVNNEQIAAQRKIANDRKATAAERAQARITLRDLQARNAQLLAEQTQYGTRAQQIAKTKALLASKALLDGLKDRDPDVRQHWIDVKTAAEAQLKALQSESLTYGYNTGKNFASGIRKSTPMIEAAAGSAAAVILEHFKPGSPTKRGPLGPQSGGPERFGSRIVELLARGMASRVAAVAAASSTVAAAAIPRVSAPTALGSVATASGARPGAPAGAGGGSTYNFNIPVQGLVRARNPLEIATQARRMARLGIMSTEAHLK